MMNELQVDGRSAPIWKTLPLGSFVTFQRGYDLPHRMRRAGGIPLVSSAGITDFHNVAMVNGPGVVTGRYGTIGELFYVEEPFWPLNTTLYVRDFQGNLPKYAYYLLQRFDFHSFSGKSGVPGVNRNDLHSETVKISTDLEEQRAIATALSDVDALIAGLEKLIAKKRNLKQAAMQQLLTGQTRLPGFSGEWKYLSLGELCSLKSGTSITSIGISDQGAYRCFGGNGLRGYTPTFTHNGSHALIGRQGALCGNVVGVQGKFFASEHALVVTPRIGVAIEWLTFVLGRMNLNQYSESSAQPGLSAFKLVILEVLTPPSEAEQAAIAEALASFDAELSALESRLAKNRELKQGMMQELLTGKTRLI